MKKDFVWGVATASYQIEGAYNEDGKGLNIWDVFCEKKGNIFEEHTGNIACDHYHRYKEDIKIMKDLGVQGYRFSISWARIFPKGYGEVNQKGIDFYNNIIDELIANDIIPFITLYHWDLPLELHYKGGWLNRDISDWFSEYAKVVVENFSDRATNYITFNEPQCFIGFGYNGGQHAPGMNLTWRETVLASHNVMLAHGKAVLAMRKAQKQPIKIGYAPTGSFAYPNREDDKECIDFVREKTFAFNNYNDNWCWTISWWSDPIVLGSYPKQGLEIMETYLPSTWKEDLGIIHQPIDFYGTNLYNGYVVDIEKGKEKFVTREIGAPKTGFDWPITPQAMRWGVYFLYERYKLPIYITENGLACQDVVSLDGKVHDPNRIDFLNKYLIELKKAINDGVDVRGYFQWSYCDNFEWWQGYNKRFGVVFIDYNNQKRIIKDSGYWYKKIIESDGNKL